MGAVWMLAALEIRRRWRSVVVLGVLVGVVGAVVMGTAAGARRSDTALARFNSSSRSADVQIVVRSFVPPTAMQLRALARLHGVAAFAALDVFEMIVSRAPNLADIAAATDTNFATKVDAARVVAGHAADPTAVDQITIGESLATSLHLRVGDHLDALSYSLAQVAATLNGNTNPVGQPAGPHVRLRIVGIVRRPLDLGDRGANGGVLVETPAFYHFYADQIGSYGTTFRIRTRHGASDVARVAAGTKRIFPDAIFVQVSPLAAENNDAQDAIHVLTAALWIFAGVVGLAGAVAITIMLGREIALAAVDQPTLNALGLTRRQRTAIPAYPALVIAGAGAFFAVVGAVAASPLFPIGVAGRADPDRGVHLDWPVLGLGILAIAAVVVLTAAVAAYLSSRPSTLGVEDGARRHPSKAVELAARAGLAPTATSGLSMALEPGRGRTAVPVRSAYLGAVFGIAGVIAVLTLASSVQNLATTPHLYGWTADYAVTDNNSTADTCGRTDYGLAQTPGIAAVAAVCSSPVQFDGHTLNGFSFASLRGTIEPEVLQGHAPNKANQIALGSLTLRTLNKHVGDTIRALGPQTKHSYRIVARIVLPELGSAQPLADGATFTDRGLQKIADANQTSRYLLLRFAPNVDKTQIEHRIATNPQLISPTGPTVPPEIDRLRQIDWFPTTIAAILAALALLAVGHALITAVRRRRRDLALLKTLGFNRRQVAATIAWQASTLAAVGLIIGIPAGLALGSLVWRLIANSVGVPTTTTIPALTVLLVIPAALLLVNLTAYLPARTAQRTRPAVALRTE